jgi:hypothetical protein
VNEQMPARALTILVVVMGAMIVAGFALIAAKIAGRFAQPAIHSSSAQPFVAAPVEMPRGAHIVAIGAGSDRAVVAISSADGSQELLIIDLATGRRLGTVPLQLGR